MRLRIDHCDLSRIDLSNYLKELADVIIDPEVTEGLGFKLELDDGLEVVEPEKEDWSVFDLSD
jgi:hypothetical protein